ncbi:MAG: protein kinase [Candidatus Eisenbacteria bacterium]|uniref:Protein kinase n=1 Tax=Eiseniibacteriota bacterium TaxID=2212470 RepID=A0A933SBL5_UNCEI|nr:protein kinase [Candidatus Eisenbacteria bacterium]
MALAAGDRLGLYEIVAPLGAGGMGEVYRARDTRLDRVVAIKVLPEAFAEDPERLARFEREARLLASLNHPNIAALHGLESEGGRRYIAMEFVDGLSLAQRLASGALPIEDALDVARQVATALEAAHEGGIVHRDLKPGNVMLRPDGTVKVLDFGLAKGAAGSASDSSLSMSPTRTNAMTGDGMILGTAAYMSPEQARGKPVDRRADIWSFGCVLFECLTGRQAFEGETVSDLIASILKGTIEWDALPAATPPRVRTLLERCLERDARQRLRDIGEARLVLEQPGSAEAPAAAPAVPARAPLPIAALVGGALLLAAIASFAAWTLKPAPRVATTWAELMPPAGGRWEWTVGGDGAVSPDGRWFISSATDSLKVRRLVLRDIETGGVRPLGGTEEGSYPFWSPDGKSIGFFMPGRLQRLELDGGSITTIAPAPDGRGGAWNTAGQIVFSPSARAGLRVVSASGGEVRTLVPDSLHCNYRFPHFLPDGRHFLVGRMEAGAPHSLLVMSLEGGAPRSLGLPASTFANAYFARGLLFYNHDYILRARPFDPARLEFTGEAMTVTTPVTGLINRGHSDFSVGGDGTIVFRSQLVRQNDQIVVRDREGRMLRTIPTRGELQDLNLSPDGSRLATALKLENASWPDVWLFDTRQTAESRLTFNQASDDAVFSPDGSRIAFQADSGVWTRATDGSGAPERVLTSLVDASPTQWVDANTLLLTSPTDKPGTRADVIISLDLPTAKTRGLIEGELFVRDAQVSPDGRWIAYVTASGSLAQVFVMDYPGLRSRWQVSQDGGTAPRWRRDGRELLFLDLDDQLLSAAVSASGASLTFGAPVVLFQHRMGGHVRNRIHSWAVDAGAQRFYMLEPSVPEEPRAALTLVRGWQPPRAGRK